jgi:hypothetical protein
MRLILALALTLLPGIAGAYGPTCTTNPGQPAMCVYEDGGWSTIHRDGRVEYTPPIGGGGLPPLIQRPRPRTYNLKPECFNVDAKGRWRAC